MKELQQHKKQHEWLPKERRKKKCHECDLDFDTLRDFRMHKKEHEFCPQDNYDFDSEQALFNCKICGAEYTEEQEILEHLKTHNKTYTCEKCQKVFQNPYNYAIHMYEHNNDEVFCCPLCHFTTLRRSSLRTHINLQHLRMYPHQCKQCGKGFNDIVLYEEHNNAHLGLKPFTCVVCDAKFPNSRYLASHQARIHTVTVHKCPECKKHFKNSVNLRKHMRCVHVEREAPYEKKHLCDMCGKSFARKDKLVTHYRTHTGYKPFKCSYCVKQFTKREYLVLHERIHSGEKPYECNFCGKRYNQDAPWRIHLRSHTGERPYVCHLCSNGFTSKAALTQHLKCCKGVNL